MSEQNEVNAMFITNCREVRVAKARSQKSRGVHGVPVIQTISIQRRKNVVSVDLGGRGGEEIPKAASFQTLLQ